MKINQQLPQNLIKNQPQEQMKNEKQVSFGGGFDTFTQFLRFLDTNQAWGATAIDITCMGTPRTAVDFTRGPAAGLETMRREFSSTADDAAIGAFGFGAAYLLAKGLGINKKYDLKAHKLFISDDMLDVLGHAWDSNKNSDNQLKDYLNSVLSDTKGFNPEHSNIDAKGWAKIDDKTQENVVEALIKETKENPNQVITKDKKAYIRNLMGESLGSEHNIKLEETINGELKSSTSNLDDYIDNLFKVSKAFLNKNVDATFKAADLKSNAFIKALKGVNKHASIAGLAIATIIGCSLQPINMYLTKKKTGQSGFVGVEGREPDNSPKFKLLKGAFAGVAGLAVLRSIGSFGDIMSKVRFKGLAPTIPQYKLVYGFTIVSRLLSARDKNELRETSIKDSLGFVNWLILGGFVSKLAAAGIEKLDRFKSAGEKFVKYNANEHGSGKFNWLTKSEIITRDEVLYEAFKKAGRSTLKADGKTAMTFKEMLHEAKSFAPKAVSKVKWLGAVQFAGYLWSGLVLGMGIPKLNIAITKSVEAQRKAKEARLKEKQAA